jgi:hypothetical protein
LRRISHHANRHHLKISFWVGNLRYKLQDMKTAIIQAKEDLVVPKSFRISLLLCGLGSAIFYAVMNIICAMQYEGYNAASQTVSELSAIGAPTRPLWVSFSIVYALLSIAFGFGLWLEGRRNKKLRIAGVFFIVYIVIGMFWPPMHQREVLAAGGGTISDTMHIVFTVVTVPLMILSIVFAAAAFGRMFRVYSVATIITMLVFGVMTGLDSPAMEANLPTPWMGVFERISMGAYYVWQLVLSAILLRSILRKSDLR